MSDLSKAYPPILYQASAGTGKTYTLTNRFLRLLLAGEKPERILATTFTRKASAEIRERVLQRLSKACLSKANCQELAVQLDLPNISLQALRESLKLVLQNIDRLEILTFDSLIVKLCRAFAPELGLSPEWSLLDTVVSHKIARNAFQKVLEKFDSAEIILLLNAMQSGNADRQVAISLITLLQSLTDLYLETSNEAWKVEVGQGSKFEDKDKLRLLEQLDLLTIPLTKGNTPRKYWLESYSRIKRQLSNSTPAQEFSVVRELLEVGIVKKQIEGQTTYDRVEIPPEWINFMQELVVFLANHLRFELGEQAQARNFLLAHYVSELQNQKNESASYGFTDIKRLFGQHAQKHVLDHIYYRLDSSIKHILLDEFQDTSLKEWNSIEPFVNEVLSKSGEDYSFFCVGDVKQAIYGWRGGVAEIFELLKETWQQIEVRSLDRSYRSAPIIINFVNQVFSKIPDLNLLERFPQVRADWGRNFKLHNTDLEKHAGYVQIEKYSVKTEEYESEDGQENIEDEFEKDQSYTGLEVYLDQLRLLVSQPSPISIAILVRTNRQVAECIEYLRRNLPAISVSDEGGNALAQSEAVALVFSFLTLLDYPADSFAWFHVLNTPLAKELNLCQAGTDVLDLDVISKLNTELLNNGLHHIVSKVCKLLKPCYRTSEYRRLEQVEYLSRRYPAKDSIRTASFVNWAKLQKIEDAESAKIRVMTVHQAKGLEFDAVFLPNLGNELIGRTNAFDCIYSDPLHPAIGVYKHIKQTWAMLLPEYQKASFQEESKKLVGSLCVLYVAFTRAKHALYISFSDTKNKQKLNANQLIIEALDISIDAESTVYKEGSESWYTTIDEHKLKSTAKNYFELPEQISLPVLNYRKRGRLVESVTNIVKAEQPDAVQIFRDLQNQVFKRGNLIHKVLEKIKWLDEEEDILPDIIKQVDPQGFLSREDFEFLNRDEFRAYFTKANYLVNGITIKSVSNELRVLFSRDDKIITGTIDRVVYGTRADGSPFVQILDFKTDRLYGDKELVLAEKNSRYKKQLDLYSEYLSKLYNLPMANIEQVLMYVSEQILERRL